MSRQLKESSPLGEAEAQRLDWSRMRDAAQA